MGPRSKGVVAQNSAGAGVTGLGFGRHSLPAAPLDAQIWLRGFTWPGLHRVEQIRPLGGVISMPKFAPAPQTVGPS